MRLVRTHKLFLAIGICLLVGSIFSPFATNFQQSSIFSPFATNFQQSSTRGYRTTFWSFMHLGEWLKEINGVWVATWVQWYTFSQYWGWWGGLSHTYASTILIPTFFLQIVAVGLGLNTLLKANTAKKIIPITIAMLTLNFLYFAGSQALRGEVFIGFWLSLMSTMLIITASVYTRTRFIGYIYYGHEKGQFEKQLRKMESTFQCSSCRNPLPDGNFDFCPYCGTSLSGKKTTES